MTYTITIMDADTRAPLPRATVQFKSVQGGVTWKTFSADDNGQVLLDSVADHDLLSTDVNVWVTADGYGYSSAPGIAVLPDTEFLLDKQTNVLPFLVGGLALGALLFLPGKRKKKQRARVVGGFFDSIDPRVKNGIVIAGALGVAWWLFNKDTSNKKLATAARTALDELASRGIYPTISQTEAEGYAGALVIAFDDCGTDETVVYGVMNALKNLADIYLLISVYDVRDYKGCFDGDYFSEHSFNLAEALNNELSSGEMAQVNNILKSKGIAYTF